MVILSINMSGLQYITKKRGILGNLMQTIQGKMISSSFVYGWLCQHCYVNQSYNGHDSVEIEIKIVSTTQSRSEHSQRLSFSPKFVQRASDDIQCL